MAKFKADLDNKTAPVKPKATRANTEAETTEDKRGWKEIDGKRMRVKYKSFRISIDLLKELHLYSVKTDTPTENVLFKAITEYLKNHPA
jgi:hypothetical protein